MRALVKVGLVMGCVATLVACGGGGGGTGVVSTALGGVAATGAAISGGNVTAVCAAGTVPSTTTDSSGNYSLNTTQATLPCAVRVSIPGTSKYVYSLAEAGATTANVTPLTHLLSDLLFGADSATVFANFGSTYAQNINSTNITAAKAKVVSTLSALGIDISTIDPLKGAFTPTTSVAAGDATDQKLDQLATALTAANKSLTEISTAINANGNAQSVASIVGTSLGASAKSLNGCPYVRGGNYWTFTYDGSAFKQWTIDLTAMTATLYGTSNVYPVSQLTANGVSVNCAFTITLPDSVVTAYFSKSSIFAWKQQMNSNGGWYFGLGVPVQTQTDLKTADYFGTYPMLGYLAYQSNGSKYQAALPMEIAIDSSGNVKSASCSLTNGAPVCGSLSSSSSGNLTCGTVSTGYISCTSSDNSVSAKVFGIVSQQQPIVFMLMSGTVSNAPYTALVVGTKSSTLKLPTVGSEQVSSTAWYFSRAAQNNPNTNWTFASGDTTSGNITTVASVSTANGSYTSQNGLIWYLNMPLDGEVWTPSVTNTNFANGSSQMLTLATNGGWSMRVTGLPSATTFNNFNGVEFFIKKPVVN